MSLWRVKHTLSPVVEAALIATVASYGLLAIYLSWRHPFDVASLSPIVSFPQPVTLDVDTWNMRVLEVRESDGSTTITHPDTFAGP